MYNINPDSIRWAYYCPAWIDANKDGCACVEMTLTTGGKLSISIVNANALPDNADTARELTPAQAVAIITANVKED